jgi:hypothetical protein
LEWTAEDRIEHLLTVLAYRLTNQPERIVEPWRKPRQADWMATLGKVAVWRSSDSQSELTPT